MLNLIPQISGKESDDRRRAMSVEVPHWKTRTDYFQASYGVLLVLLLVFLPPASAQSAVGHAPQQKSDTVAALPLIDPVRELAGRALVEALKQGGFVFYMRHAQNAGASDPPCAQSDLTPLGLEQARTVGQAISTLGIPLGRVMASELCRTQGTARIVDREATLEITEDLNPVAPRPGFDIGAARRGRLSALPPPGKNTLLVSHMHGGRNKAEWLHLDMAEIIVFRPDANGQTVPVARIPVAKWSELLRVMKP